MTEKPSTQTPSPEEIPWAVTYLHGSIQDVRHELRSRFEEVNQRFDAMDRKFDAMDRKFDAMDRKFELLIKRMDARFMWLMSSMITLAGLVVAILKL